MRCVLNFTTDTEQGFQVTGGQWTTIGQILAPDHKAVQLVEANITFRGIVATAYPVLCQVVRQSDAGSGGDAKDLVHEDHVQAEHWTDHYKAIQTTGLVNIDTTEPTLEAVLRSWYIHPQTGIVYPYRPSEDGREKLTVIPEHRLGVRVYPAADQDVYVTGGLVISEGNLL